MASVLQPQGTEPGSALVLEDRAGFDPVTPGTEPMGTETHDENFDAGAAPAPEPWQQDDVRINDGPVVATLTDDVARTASTGDENETLVRTGLVQSLVGTETTEDNAEAEEERAPANRERSLPTAGAPPFIPMAIAMVRGCSATCHTR